MQAEGKTAISPSALTRNVRYQLMSQATNKPIAIPLSMPEAEAGAFGQLLKRMTYDDCARLSNRTRKYPDGRTECDTMWSAVCIVQDQFRDAGFAPR
jgi:hypothetical protein